MSKRSSTRNTPLDPTRYPALYRRWLRSPAGKKYQKEQEAPKIKRQRELTKHPNSQKIWREKEDQWLRQSWGSLTLLKMAQHLGRSERAVSHRARDLDLLPANQAHGALSLRAFSHYSGFSITKIKNTAKVLKIHLHSGLNSEAGARRSKNRRGGTRVYQRSRTKRILPEQQHELMQYMLEHPIVRTQKKKGDQMTRLMLKKDIDHLRTFSDLRKRYEFQQVLISKKLHCLVTPTADPKGYIMWDENPLDLHLFSIAVHPNHRRQGIAKSLLEVLIRIAKTRSIVLEVRVENEGAIRLYKLQRFEILGRKIKYYDDGGDAYVMAKLGN